MSSLIFFLLALAILITIHEFGHFWVARKCGVKVLKFSVGFGKPLWRKSAKDGTEYVIAAIPLGGYVKMLDEREGEVAEEDLEYAFNRQPLRARVAIVAAGPIANLLFAVLCYWFIFVLGIPGIRPIIGDVTVNSPAAQAHFIAGDEILTINENETPTWMSVQKRMLELSSTGGKADFKVTDGGVETVYQLVIPKVEMGSSNATTILNDLGITPVRISLAPVLGHLAADGPAKRAGLMSADQVLSINGNNINDWTELVSIVRASPEKALLIVVKRVDEVLEFSLTPDRVEENEKGFGRIGAGVDTSKFEIPPYLQAELRFGPGVALFKAIEETWNFSSLTIKSLAGMLSGNLSSKNLGGPISIAQYAGSSADRGVISFVGFLAIISISLGILNLLPIPILDGGHLAFYLIEWIRGKPLSDKMQAQGQRIGLILLLMLMFLAFFNDLSRLFGQ